ncbi:MAG: DNA repair protein RecN [Chthoniobacterales bacterium]
MAAVLNLLRIKNLALVEDLQWQLRPGFTAITGETGAGKSIIIGALQLLLGERADKGLIRTGAETCTVEAVFEGPGLTKLNADLTEAGVEPCAGELILKRSFSATGGNRQFINGSPTTLAVLKNLGDELVDLHGPHDHQSILSPERQLGLLDAFARAENAVGDFGRQFRAQQALLAEQKSLSTAESVREQEVELLHHQVSEITAANLVADEEEGLETRYKLASNSRRLIELASAISRRLSEADESVLSQLAESQRLLRELAKIDPAMEEHSTAHANSAVELSEIARTMDNYAGRVELDPAQLAALEQRISLFETLKHKYGGSIPEVVAAGERAIERLRQIEGRDATLERLAREIANGRSHLQRAGAALHDRRAKAAPKLADHIRRNLRDLGFKQSGFEVKLGALEQAKGSGFDAVELLFSPNPGEPLKPLRTIASSGEISRLMLAIKSSLAAQDAIPLLVFDEIDANVGGEIAHAVGAKMRALAIEHQVLCITHLPQVAAAASAHFVVTKEVSLGRTYSELREVTSKERQAEIARMLGGQTQSALLHARTLLKGAPAHSPVSHHE